MSHSYVSWRPRRAKLGAAREGRWGAWGMGGCASWLQPAKGPSCLKVGCQWWWHWGDGRHLKPGASVLLAGAALEAGDDEECPGLASVGRREMGQPGRGWAREARTPLPPELAPGQEALIWPKQQPHRVGCRRTPGRRLGQAFPLPCSCGLEVQEGPDPPSLHLCSQAGLGTAAPDTPRSHGPGRCPGRAGLTHGTRISRTLLMTCLPTMMTRSSCASSMRQPPAAHYSSRVSAQLGGGTGLTPTFWTPQRWPPAMLTPPFRTCHDTLRIAETLPPSLDLTQAPPRLPQVQTADCAER